MPLYPAPSVATDTSAGWTAKNPVLPSGAIGVDTTLGLLKIGNGVTTWASLPVPAPIANGGSIFFANAGGQPATPGSGGYVYVLAGALKYVGSSGTVTPLANA